MTGPTATELDPRTLEESEQGVERLEDGREEAEDELFQGVGLAMWQPTIRERIREAWESRDLLRPLSFSLLPTYGGRILGRAWIVLRPLMTVLGFGFIFGQVFGAKAPNQIPYLLFMIFNMQAFRLFDYTLIYETVSMRTIRKLTTGLRLPLLLVPFASLLRVLVTMSVYWTIAAVALVYYFITKGHFYLQLGPRLLIGILGLVLCIAFGMALGLWTMTLYPRARDVRYFVRYGVQFWMLFTPVFYSLQSLPDSLQIFVSINPLTPVLSLVQYGFLDAGTIKPWSLVWSLVCITLAGIGGLWFFNRYATRFVGMATVNASPDDEDDDVF